MLSTTVNALYVSSRPGAMTLSAGSVILALVAGIGVAVGSALAPAREASMVPPTEAMARGRREFEVRVDRKRDAFIALVLAVLGTLAAQAPPIGGKPLLGYLSALLFVAAAAFACSVGGVPRHLRGVDRSFAACSESRHCSRRAAWADRCAERPCWWRRWPRPSP